MYTITLFHIKFKMSKPYVSIEDPNSKENVEKMGKYQKWVFAATFFNYAMAHWTRK